MSYCLFIQGFVFNFDRPCVGVKEEPAEEESWYCSKCMGRSKKPAKRGRGRGRGRGPGRGKKKMM